MCLVGNARGDGQCHLVAFVNFSWWCKSRASSGLVGDGLVSIVAVLSLCPMAYNGTSLVPEATSGVPANQQSRDSSSSPGAEN